MDLGGRGGSAQRIAASGAGSSREGDCVQPGQGVGRAIAKSFDNWRGSPMDEGRPRDYP